MATGSIVDFITSFKTDLARPSRFEVVVTPSRLLRGGGWGSDMTFRCEAAELPGKTFMTHDQKTYGPTEKFPYQHAYNDINLTFIVSDDMKEKKMFEEWIETVSPIDSYNFNYRDNYSGSVQITQFDVTGKPIYKVELVNAYPIGLNQLDLDWSSDGHHKLVVTLAYTYWEQLPTN